VTFNEKIDYLKDFLFDVMKPSIKEYMQARNPDELDRWQGNCCRQTSLITNWYLRQWLLNNDSGYIEIQSWDGEFRDFEKGKHVSYDHAWVYCINEDRSKNLLVDIARNHRPLLCMFTPINRYPSDGEYQHMRLISKERMNEKNMWNQREFLTQELIKDIVPKLTKYMRSQGVLKRKKQPATV
jgi:hypothetical protein